MKIAVIPARGGSKRIPQKNVKSFANQPMISWAIQAAQKSQLFDEVIVSTDSQSIAEVAISYGASAPFIRPEYLSDDYTGTTDVVAHAAEWLLSKGYQPTEICCIYATAAFLRAEDLIKSLELFRAGQWDYLFSVTRSQTPVFRSFLKSTQGGVEMLFPEHLKSRSQDLPSVFYDAAQFYWGRQAVGQIKKLFFQSCPPPLNSRVGEFKILIPRKTGKRLNTWH